MDPLVLTWDDEGALRGRITPSGPDAGGSWAGVIGENPLSSVENASAGIGATGPERVVAWSGTLGEGRFDADPRNWGAAGWGAFDAWCDAAAPVLIAKVSTVLFRPHAAHVLSDAPSCARFLSALGVGGGGEGGGGTFGLLLDPVAMLTEGMLPRAEDHLRRLLGALAGLPGVAGVVVSNTDATAGGRGWAPLDGEAGAEGKVGGLDPGMIVRLMREYVPEGVPLVVESAGPADLRAQLALLADPEGGP